MYGLILFGLMFVLMILGVPVAFSILLSGAGFLAFTGFRPLVLVGSRMVAGMNSFIMLAIPLFICSGYIMEGTSLAKRLVDFVRSFLGGVYGSMGMVTVVTCAIFAALTGSGPATVAAIGTIMMPALMESGYSRETSSGLIASGGALGPIIPPSGNMIVYGAAMGVSIGKMFIGGVLPGLFITFALCATNSVLVRKIGLPRPDFKFESGVFWRSFLRAIPTLLIPIIVLGGIYGGIFTPTEAAVVSVVYSLVYGLASRELHLKQLYTILKKTCIASGTTVLIIAAANLFSWILSATKLPAAISAALLSVVTNKYTYLFILMVILFIVGCIMDTIPSILILAPILVPPGIELGISELHLAVLFCITLTVGFITPPFGINLFTAVTTCKTSYEGVVKGIIPFMIVMMVCVFIVAFFPFFTTYLPNLMYS